MIQLSQATHKIDYRSKESFSFAREIFQPWGGLEHVMNWCKSELTGEWRWQLVEASSYERPGRYIFYFDSDRDLCAFVMQWS